MQLDPRASSAVQDFAEAVRRFDVIAAADDESIAPGCGSILLSHGRRVGTVLVLFHGFTNCPAQWSAVAHDAYAAGCNVIAPRAEGHGRADRKPHDLGAITAESLKRWVDEIIDVAAGLGDEVIVAGFSFGGVCASWAACARDEVAHVLLLAPSFLPIGYPLWSAALLPAACRALPERHLWWDPVRKDRTGLARHVYPQLSRRGIGEVFALGLAAWREDPARKTSLQSAFLVLNESDLAISPRAAQQVFRDAIAPLSKRSAVVVFPSQLRYPHDLIDPQGPNAAAEAAVRARLLSLLGIEG